ncbi:hypothetical protein [Streptomyces sp. MI02-7b]|uniref:hypothetical protein n=1 Tax=Streptomyces sp. MI02-7b TaxID=462941 RepID=UPI0029A141C4|nr:hypothetical protein [Streptomyces sp. MI02-7b]MDX3075891.1 hypothetical protein [Streptomyces sp. MI02-7b]
MSRTKHHRRHNNRPRASVVLTAMAATALTLSACSSGNEAIAERAASSPNAPTTTATSAATVPDPKAEARASVVAAFRGLTKARTAGLAKATFTGTDIERYASGQVLADAKQTLLINRANNIVTKGQPAFTVTTTSVDMSVTPHRGTLTVCWDDTDWTPVNKASGKSVAVPGQSEQYPVTSKLRTIGPRWVVTDSTAQRDQTC